MGKVRVKCLILLLFTLLNGQGFSAGFNYIDDLFRLATKAKKYKNLTKLEFATYLKHSHIDDIIPLIRKLPSDARVGTLLEIAAEKNLIKPTQVLQLNNKLKHVSDYDTIIITYLKYDNTNLFFKLARDGRHLKRAGISNISGFKSFDEFKKIFGAAGEGKAWHHIVEQTSSNVKRFGPEAVHNKNNLVALAHGKSTIHSKISGYYSSKQPFTGGKTVREWLYTKSYQEQYEFGVKIIKQFGGSL